MTGRELQDLLTQLCELRVSTAGERESLDKLGSLFDQFQNRRVNEAVREIAKARRLAGKDRK